MSQQSDAEPVSNSAAQDKTASQFVGFQLADQNYAFPIEQIQEIVILSEFTRVPQVPEFVDGVTNLRGNIIPLINLRRLFGLEPISMTDQTRTIVVNVKTRTMGCTVDSVSHVIRIADDQIQPVPEIVTANRSQYITGFAKLDDGLTVLLNVNELLDPSKLDSVHVAAQAGIAELTP